MSSNQLNTVIELHLIQNFAPANLNRDDTGSPKDCDFGGYRRARISSQSLKRAIRFHPRFEALTGVENGVRSKWLVRSIKEVLMEKYGKGEQEAIKVAYQFVEKYATKKDKTEEQSNTLIFFTPQERDEIAKTLVENWEALLDSKKGKDVSDSLVKTMIKQTKGRTSAPDVALFGRMLASTPELNIDAACQVAHAISTHRVTMEMDYYTAVDELLKTEETGAAMVGFTGFNSACFYRYARIDYNLLLQNLDNDADLAQKTVAAFLRATLDAIPTGKQNSFAAQNPTSFALAVLRQDGMSWNLANAFESPVQNKHKENTDRGYIAPSIKEIDKLWGALTTFYDDALISALSLFTAEGYQDQLTNLANARQQTVTQWLEKITQGLKE